MKRILVAGMALGLMACGLKVEDLIKKAAASTVSAGKFGATAHTLTEGLLNIQGLSGGISGLAPNFKSLGGNTSVALSPSASLAPGLRTAAVADLCPLANFSATVTNTETTFPAQAEEKDKTTTLVYSCDASKVFIPKSVKVEINYKDGGTGTQSAVEATGATDTVDDNLLTGFVVFSDTRKFPTTDERVSRTVSVELDTAGTLDSDLDDSYRKLTFHVDMKSGASVDAFVTADPAVKHGDDLTKGHAERTTVHPAGDAIKKTTEVADITGKDLGTYQVVNEYTDGTKDDIKVTSTDGVNVGVVASGHDGFKREGSLNLTTGVYSLVTTFPAGSEITTVTESGTWKKGDTSGTYKRDVVFANGKTESLSADVKIADNTLTVKFSHTDVNAETITGDLTLVKSESDVTLTLNVANAAGDTANITGTRYADGSAKLHIKADLKATTVNPDEEGDFSFKADGSGTGTVTIKKDDGSSVTATVAIQANGTTVAKDASGKAITGG